MLPFFGCGIDTKNFLFINSSWSLVYTSHFRVFGPARSIRGNLMPWSAPVARVHPRITQQCYLPCLGYYGPQRCWPRNREGGEDTDGDQRRSGIRQEGLAQRGEGARSDHKNTLPLRGRLLGHIRLYEERRRGVGRERRAPRESNRDQERLQRQHRRS